MTEKEEFNHLFGERVRQARHLAKLRAEDVAEAAGITPQFLSEVERGKKGMGGYNVSRLARSLRVTSDYLLYGREESGETWAMAAEHLTALPPALRDMARDVLEMTLSMLITNIPQ
ncbi:MAG: helix-turn-helix transcriptional regulator [Pseudoflavonifractor sp.]